jgi:hypothetical protein
MDLNAVEMNMEVSSQKLNNVARWSILLVVVVVVFVWEGCDTAKAQPGLHHGDRAYRQVNSLYRTLYNFDLPGRGQCLLVNRVTQ